MQIISVPINKIKPDPNQPRQTLDHDKIGEMAQSIITEGVINPIEIDSKNFIITGELRWRAARVAKLKEVPCKVLKIADTERFRRQVIENIHHNTMSDWDTAKAIEKLLSDDSAQGRVRSTKQKKGGLPDKGIAELSRQIGKGQKYIIEKLDLLKASVDFQKAVRSEQVSGTFIRVLKRTPEAHRKQMEEKILNGEFTNRDNALIVVQAIQDNPNKIEALLKQDYSNSKSYQETHALVDKIAPSKDKQLRTNYEPIDELNKIHNDLKEWLEYNPAKSFGLLFGSRAIMAFASMQEAINDWLTINKTAQVKQLEGK